MAECLLTLGGARCLPLGPETPPEQIAGAAGAHKADVVALSFSAMVAPDAAREAIADLRAQLPAKVELWVGGGCPALQDLAAAGVRPLVNLADVPETLDGWRAAQAV
jgi:methylmalonyl-CoA mutase cobalamin-binding subunit